MRLKKFFLFIAHFVCRLISSVLWQLVWLLPLWGLLWYGRFKLPLFIKSHFGVDQIQDRLVSLEHFVEVMKENSSISNPSSIFNYISAQLTKLNFTLKLNTAEMISNIFQSTLLWFMDAIWFIALIYAIIRAIRLFREKSGRYNMAHQIAKQITPEIFALRQDISALQQQVAELKKMAQPISEDHHEPVPALPPK